MAAILDLDELLSRIAILTKRVIDYRTFGILLVNEATNQLEPKVALQYGERTKMLTIDVGSGLVGYAAQHKEIVLVDDVSADPRYIAVVDDVRSELVIPLLLKDRCIGVFDLESPELAAFTTRHADMLRILASQAAVAIDNARLYETRQGCGAQAGAGDRVRAPCPDGAAARGATQAAPGHRSRGQIRARQSDRRRSATIS